MERHISMKLRGLSGIFCCVFAFLLSTTAAFSHHQVVLVTNSSCPIDTISSLELRKIYFGIKVKHNHIYIKGIHNLSNDQLDNIFLQTVVAMSSKSYQRRLLAQSLNIGRPRIAKFSDIETLLTELRKIPCNVTYMWENKANEFDDLKIIKLLWQKN
jgi:hypothetical protein